MSGRVFVLLINQFIMPRPTSTVWESFLVLCETDGKKHVTCSYCSVQYKHAMANKLKNHLLKCDKCPNDVKNFYKQNHVPSIQTTSEATVSAPASTSSTKAPSAVTPLLNSDASYNTTFTTQQDENGDKPVKYELEFEIDHGEKETEEDDDPLESEDEPAPVDEPSRSPPPTKLVRVTPRNEFVRASSSQNTPKHWEMFNEGLSTPKQEKQDQFDVFGMNVASKLREISIKDNTQRLIAEKIINDALFYAEMGRLTLAHCNKLNLEPKRSTQ